MWIAFVCFNKYHLKYFVINLSFNEFDEKISYFICDVFTNTFGVLNLKKRMWKKRTSRETLNEKLEIWSGNESNFILLLISAISEPSADWSEHFRVRQSWVRDVYCLYALALQSFLSRNGLMLRGRLCWFLKSKKNSLVLWFNRNSLSVPNSQW